MIAKLSLLFPRLVRLFQWDFQTLQGCRPQLPMMTVLFWFMCKVNPIRTYHRFDLSSVTLLRMAQLNRPKTGLGQQSKRLPRDHA